MIKRSAAMILVAGFLASCGGGGTEGGSTDSDQAAGPDTVTTASGLRYVMLEEGEGASPANGEAVNMHFKVSLPGQPQPLFNTKDRGVPQTITVGVGQVFPGWDEAMMLLAEGGKATFIVPPALGLGEQGGNGVPPNSEIVLDLEMIEIGRPIPHEPFSTEGLEKLTTESGLEYYIIEEGDGPQAKSGDQVGVHYYGYLKEDGERFDDSFSRGLTFNFALGQGMVIRGWDEGIALLKEGTKATLVIPYQLAYGEMGNGRIPAKADLVFDVWLKKVN